MGRIAYKRGGGGGRNAPPDVYVPFGDIEHGPDAKPVQAIVGAVATILILATIGFILWVLDSVNPPR